MIIIKRIIETAVCFWAAWLVMRYNLHMFQLNSYKNKEQKNWLKKNLNKQTMLFVLLVLGLLYAVKPVLILEIAGYIVLLFVIFFYNFYRKKNTKKKLVYTARVKRLIGAVALVTVLAVCGICAFDNASGMLGAGMMAAALQPLLVLFGNFINRPIEKGVNNYYINDAKKKLRSNKDLVVVGITGSYGKTSMKFFLQTLLGEKYHVLITPESYNTPMGVVKTIRQSLKPVHEIFLCEMGARNIGDIKEICDIVHPKHGIIVSVGPQHLETFLNIENITKTKFELADALPADGFLFLNGDNTYIQEKAKEYTEKTFYYTEKNENGYYATDISVSQLGTDFTVVTPNGEQERFQMNLIGAYNVANVIGAISVAHKLGVPLKELKIPVRRLRPVEHRMQMTNHGEVTIIDDAYNSNPVGSKAAVETLAMFDGVRILVTPGMVELGEKEEEYNYKFGTYAAKCCDYILLVGEKRAVPIREGVLSEGFPQEKCKVFERFEEAMAYAYAITEQGHKYILLENDLPDNY